MNKNRRFLKRDVDAANQANQLLLPLDAKRVNVETLSKARIVIIADPIEQLHGKVEVRKERASHERAKTFYRVYFNGEPVGRYDSQGPVAYRELRPLYLHGVRFKLSDGQTVTVWSRTVTVIERWESKQREDNSKYWFPHTKAFVSDTATMRLDRKIDWATANKLRRGDQVTIEYPFQWVKGRLTNGVLSFGPERPNGNEWRQYPIDPVPAACWDDFLDGLEGKFLHELLPHRTHVIARKQEEQSEKTQKLSARQEGVKRVIRSAMFKGAGCEQVVLGRNVLFIVKREKRTPLYVVDNAGVGRVYVFKTEKYARDFASGAISRTQAIKDGAFRLVHAGKWESRLARVLQAG
ncbi:MAG TPA: hypothetical protein V6C81_13285 [Planktothrix sp.]|jgi:hypothetical protein